MKGRYDAEPSGKKAPHLQELLIRYFILPAYLLTPGERVEKPYTIDCPDISEEGTYKFVTSIHAPLSQYGGTRSESKEISIASGLFSTKTAVMSEEENAHEPAETQA